jgi:beta-RFAP synthase
MERNLLSMDNYECENVRIIAPSRLHFGLFGWGPEAEMQFGGMGVMISQPCFELEVARAESNEFSVPADQRDKYRNIYNSCRDYLRERDIKLPQLHFKLIDAPQPHIGLGSGTQRALSVAAAVAKIVGYEIRSVTDLAEMARRFPRSGVGVHGFSQGGLIIDGGHASGLGGHQQIAPLLARRDWPEDWQVLLVSPHEPEGFSNEIEQNAFRILPPPSKGDMNAVKREVFDHLLTSIDKLQFSAALQAIESIQRIVGSWFAPSQSGSIYGTPFRDQLVRQMKKAGLQGVGQSSWGPTLFGFAEANKIDEIEARLFRDNAISQSMVKIIRTTVQNQPTLT